MIYYIYKIRLIQTGYHSWPFKQTFEHSTSTFDVKHEFKKFQTVTNGTGVKLGGAHEYYIAGSRFITLLSMNQGFWSLVAFVLTIIYDFIHY